MIANSFSIGYVIGVLLCVILILLRRLLSMDRALDHARVRCVMLADLAALRRGHLDEAANRIAALEKDAEPYRGAESVTFAPRRDAPRYDERRPVHAGMKL